MANYEVQLIETSLENMTARDRIRMKDISSAIKLDSVVNGEDRFVFKPVAYAILSVHNEKSKNNPDYTNYMIIDAEGRKFVTGSPSFWTAFSEIWNEMHAAGETDFELEVFKLDSKNYQGKQFLTCGIV